VTTLHWTFPRYIFTNSAVNTDTRCDWAMCRHLFEVA